MSLTFYYHMYGANIGSLTIQWVTSVGSVESVEDLYTISGQNQDSNDEAWKRITINEFVDLSPLSGSSGKIRFQYTSGTSYRGDAAIDNVNISDGVYT